jgi:K+-sensing histidine kinase KdpD
MGRTARNHPRRTPADGSFAQLGPKGIDPATPGGSLELLSSIAHEIRTPVTALATASELIREDLNDLGRDELLRIVETMHRGAIWLPGLVENLLCAATLTEGRLRIARRRIALGELAHDVTSVVEPLLRQHRQWIRVVERRDVCDMLGDGRRIGQALINLLVNASKHGQPGTRIDVLIARRRDHVRVSVADRGPGLPEQAAATLFSPFTRGMDTNRAGIDGVGAGARHRPLDCRASRRIGRSQSP